MWSDIPGWWSEACHKWYRRQVLQAPPEACFVEVGCWQGRSAVSMASSIVENNREDIVFHCYDTFQGTPPEGDAGYHQKLIREQGLDLEALFRKHVNEHGYSTIVRAWRGDSVTSSLLHGHRSLDLVFIDGDHRREMVRRDVQAWLPKLRYGGVIAGHDATAERVIAGVRDAGIEPTIEGEIWSWRKKLPINIDPPYSALTFGPLADALTSWSAEDWFGVRMCQALREELPKYFRLSPTGTSISDCSKSAHVIICPCDNHEKYLEGEVYRRSDLDVSVFPAFPHGGWPWNNPQREISTRDDLSIGFCGAPRPELRSKSIEHLLRSREISRQFIFRDGFLGGSVDREQARSEFRNVVDGNTYQLCVRGVGNYCYRLYETLSAGRIPVVVGDRPIPWDARVNYVPVGRPENIVDGILEFHDYAQPHMERLQRENRRLWLELLSPLGWWREWARRR